MSSKDFRIECEFPVSPAKLFEAVATQEGIAAWWTRACQMSPKASAKGFFLFPQSDFYAVMEIVKRDPPRLMEWKCEDCKHPDASGLKNLHDWAGTRVLFEVSEAGPERARLTFTHAGLLGVESGPGCANIWTFFIDKSLRGYLENGKGDPAAAL